MITVHFYEKPGCINNTRQKKRLTDAGCLLVIYDILQQPWAKDKARLRSFFADLPVAQWFNYSAPAIKNGDLIPERLSEAEAIERMVADPLLIRRPLLEVNGQRRAGFDPQQIGLWLGLPLAEAGADLESCPQLERRDAADGRG